jgi:hypothetical protein
MEGHIREHKSIQASVYGLSTILNLEQLLTLKTQTKWDLEDNTQYGTR